MKNVINKKKRIGTMIRKIYRLLIVSLLMVIGLGLTQYSITNAKPRYTKGYKILNIKTLSVKILKINRKWYKLIYINGKLSAKILITLGGRIQFVGFTTQYRYPKWADRQVLSFYFSKTKYSLYRFKAASRGVWIPYNKKMAEKINSRSKRVKK